MQIPVLNSRGKATRPGRPVYHVAEGEDYVVPCPYCDGYIQVPRDQMNCHIFRHDDSVGPHAKFAEIVTEKEAGRLKGCGGPFKVEVAEGGDPEIYGTAYHASYDS